MYIRYGILSGRVPPVKVRLLEAKRTDFSSVERMKIQLRVLGVLAAAPFIKKVFV